MSAFSALRDQYGGFAVPSYEISVGGAVLDRGKWAISELSVDLGVDETCNACRFQVEDIYDHASRGLSADVKGTLKLGAKVEVALGYGSAHTPVFCGYLERLELRFTAGGVSASASCLDARGLMRRWRRRVRFNKKTVKEAAEAVLQRYGALFASHEVKLDAGEPREDFMQEEDDLAFVLELAREQGMHLLVQADKAVVDKSSDEVCVVFDWGVPEVAFHMEYLDANYVGTGCDPAAMEPFRTEQAAKQTAAQETLLTVQHSVRLSPSELGDVGTRKIAEMAATALRGSIGGSVTCPGLPELMLGKKLQIKDFPLDGVGDTFAIASVSHQVGEGGFQTTVQIER